MDREYLRAIDTLGIVLGTERLILRGLSEIKCGLQAVHHAAVIAPTLPEHIDKFVNDGEGEICPGGIEQRRASSALLRDRYSGDQNCPAEPY